MNFNAIEDITQLVSFLLQVEDEKSPSGVGGCVGGCLGRCVGGCSGGDSSDLDLGDDLSDDTRDSTTDDDHGDDQHSVLSPEQLFHRRYHPWHSSHGRCSPLTPKCAVAGHCSTKTPLVSDTI